MSRGTISVLDASSNFTPPLSTSTAFGAKAEGSQIWPSAWMSKCWVTLVVSVPWGMDSGSSPVASLVS
jgi:hypothetical protein